MPFPGSIWPTEPGRRKTFGLTELALMVTAMEGFSKWLIRLPLTTTWRQNNKSRFTNFHFFFFIETLWIYRDIVRCTTKERTIWYRGLFFSRKNGYNWKKVKEFTFVNEKKFLYPVWIMQMSFHLNENASWLALFFCLHSTRKPSCFWAKP